MSEEIILGYGVFSIGNTDIALTRGGGQFTVEREYKQMEADGDKGPVKGRIRKTRSVAKLTLNALEILPTNIPKFYPATQNVDDVITAKEDIEDADYNDLVTWTGVTHSGKSVIITLENAINLENIDWTMTDKEEIVPVVSYTATYLPNARKTEPWKIEFV